MSAPQLSLSPMSPESAREASTWRYPPPYSIYDSSPETYKIFIEPRNRYHALHDPDGALVGFCCFGAEARVRGGRYPDLEPEVLDVGIGMRPERTGRGQGQGLLAAVLDYARESLRPHRFRATIAEFNQRSARTFARLGFVAVDRFERPTDSMAFLVYEREA